MTISTFCMHTTIILSLVTAVALSTSIIIGGILFVLNHAYALSCKSTNGNTVCKASPGSICTHLDPHTIVCNNIKDDTD